MGTGGDRLQRFSRSLNHFLRHGADGVEMDEAGYVVLDDLLRLPKFKRYSVRDVRQVVDQDAVRFQLRGSSRGPPAIRATRGHSLPQVTSNAMHPLITSVAEVGPQSVVHGTTVSAWLQIRHQGLKRMGRRCIHFSLGLAGMKASSSVVVHLNVSRVLDAGVALHKAGRVLLSPGEGDDGCLLPHFFSHATWIGPPEAVLFAAGADLTEDAIGLNKYFAHSHTLQDLVRIRECKHRLGNHVCTYMLI